MKNLHKKFWLIPLTVLSALVLISFAFSKETTPHKSEVVQNEKNDESESEALEWHTDIKKVQELSKSSGKPIFAFFTGSDWCGWCKKLQAEVFAKEAFVEWAEENVVLLELDFPKRTQLDSALQVQNYGLAKAFGVSGYPTIWIFNAELNEQTNNISIDALGSLGYPRGAVAGKEEELFLENADKVLANKAQ
ncbi:MAG: thioredoxin family protein [Crocinitomicaceae bacterium]